MLDAEVQVSLPALQTNCLLGIFELPHEIGGAWLSVQTLDGCKSVGEQGFELLRICVLWYSWPCELQSNDTPTGLLLSYCRCRSSSPLSLIACLHRNKVGRSICHIFNVERYVGWSCVLNCFMLSSLLCFPALCQSAIPTFLMFFLVL